MISQVSVVKAGAGGGLVSFQQAHHCIIAASARWVSASGRHPAAMSFCGSAISAPLICSQFRRGRAPRVRGAAAPEAPRKSGLSADAVPERRDDLRNRQRCRVGHHIGFAGAGVVAQHEADRGGEVGEADQRAAGRKRAERQRHRQRREPHQRPQVALHAGAVDEHRTQDRERHAAIARARARRRAWSGHRGRSAAARRLRSRRGPRRGRSGRGSRRRRPCVPRAQRVPRRRARPWRDD